MADKNPKSAHVHLTQEEFEQAVADAIDSLPDRFLDELDNVVFLAEDEPTPEQSPDGELLGLYDGIALTQRGSGYGAGDDWPDTITIFKGPHERLSDDRAVVLEEIRRTVVHEVGHYFGMDEEQIDQMGYA